MTDTKTTGTTPDTSGEIRLIANRDGWFVVGKGLQFPVDSREAGQALISKLLNEPAPDKRSNNR
jgi:hypothetical protein